jgi:flagellar protein FliJ
MAVFRFRMAKILRLRERAEQAAALEMARRQGRVDLCRQALANMARSRADLLARRDDLQRGRMLPSLLAENRYQLIVLERATVTRERECRNLEREVEEARLTLIARSRDRRLLEKLAERQREEFDLAELRRETRQLDESPQRSRGMAIAISGPEPHGR